MIAVQQSPIQRIKLELAKSFLDADEVLVTRNPLTDLPTRAALDLAVEDEKPPFAVLFIAHGGACEEMEVV